MQYCNTFPAFLNKNSDYIIPSAFTNVPMIRQKSEQRHFPIKNKRSEILLPTEDTH